MNKTKKAFTLLELIFVIVVLGIVVSIIAEIIAKMYGGYIEARTNDKLQSKTELAAQQIANRLSYRVGATVVATDGTDMIELRNYNQTLHPDYNILEWIGRDFVSYRGDWNGTLHTPAWSGLIDLDHTDTNSSVFVTPATRPDTLNTMISEQSFNSVSLSASVNRPAIIFRGRMDDFDVSNYYAHANTNDASSHYVYPVECLAIGCDDSVPRLQFRNDYADGNPATHAITLHEHYDLVWSAYALVPDGDELKLYYNYQPWMGDSYTDGNVSVLVDGLESFLFTQVGEVIRVKICAHESDGRDELVVCKEKAIL